MLLSTTDEDVLAAAESLGDELRQAKSESTRAEFESLLEECNEAISDATGIDYGDACDAGSDCC